MVELAVCMSEVCTRYLDVGCTFGHCSKSSIHVYYRSKTTTKSTEPQLFPPHRTTTELVCISRTADRQANNSPSDVCPFSSLALITAYVLGNQW